MFGMRFSTSKYEMPLDDWIESMPILAVAGEDLGELET